MLKWTIFAVVSLGWIAVCWFFGSMVAVSEAVPRSTIAQQECANRMVREGRATDFFAARDSAECRAVQRAVVARQSRPYLRNGLLVGALPVLLVGVLMWLRSRG